MSRVDSIITTELFILNGILNILCIILNAFFQQTYLPRPYFHFLRRSQRAGVELLLLKLFEMLKRKEGNTIIVNKISNMVVMQFKTTRNISKKERGFQKVANQFCPHSFHLCD